MIRVLVFLAVLVALAFGGAWLADQPGSVTLTVGSETVETSLWAGVLAVAAVSVLVVIAWWAIRTGLRLPQTIGFAARARRRAKGYAAVSRGMVAVGAGDPRAAKRHAEDAGKLLGNEPLALLLKAQAAQMAGDRGSAEGAFRQMLDEPETRVLGLRGLFVEARRKGDAAAARAYASEAARIAPSVSWAGEALLEYQSAEGDWAGALSTLERGRSGLDKAAYRRQRAVLLTADAMARAEREPEAALARVQEAVKLAPDLVPAAAMAARLLGRRGDLRKAAKTIEAAWKVIPHPELAAAYVGLRAGDSGRDRLTRADRLLAISQHHDEARIAVAGAAIDARDFRRARQVLEPLLRERPTVRVCLLMAEIAEAGEQDPGAVREWLARAARAPRDPAWIADGIISETWAPVSPVTGRLDAFTWGTPVEQIGAPESPAPFRRAGPGMRLPVPESDEVLVDVDEPEAGVVAAGSAQADRLAPEREEARPATAPEAPAPATAAPADIAAPEPARPAEKPAVGETAEVLRAGAERASEGPAAAVPSNAGGGIPSQTEPARQARRSAGPTPVVFPMPAPPDDPGTEAMDGASGSRSRFLQ